MRLCGVCEQHMQALPSMRPLNMRPGTPVERADAAIVRTAAGTQHRPIALIPKRPKTLMTLIQDTEAEWAAARAARGEEPLADE